ncbi:RGS domain-containing protein [Radiomyces spectabilis]|uniref:RGS domain-containing protein n=1 Tax=Radiomyces spectabilis TaxID=64574 RepID=UPI00221FE173|nr:RGS domain-containing protein [Radiomyces spectabilis]KAI8366039.1 RGS domain-containing protein [Radiomyces spectabilis]
MMMIKKRRLSRVSLNGGVVDTDTLLSTRTPKSIIKSRRASLVDFNDPRPSSRRSSLATTTIAAALSPTLLSDPVTPLNQCDSNTESIDDAHTLYKLKSSRSYRKLDKFFGEPPLQLDVSVGDIRKHGLRAMLQSKVPLCYFLYHLLEEYSCENLFFYIELQQYENFEYVSVLQQLATAQHIYNTYLTRNSHFEVNLDDNVRSDIVQALSERRVQGCFDTAKRAVYLLLENSFMQFIHTNTWQHMAENCGESKTHYHRDTRHAAVQQLIMYLERQHAMIYTSPHTDSPVFMSVSQPKRRHELIKSMIHEFCRTLIGVEFSYYRSSSSLHAPIASASPHSSPKQRHLVMLDFFSRKNL